MRAVCDRMFHLVCSLVNTFEGIYVISLHHHVYLLYSEYYTVYMCMYYVCRCIVQASLSH